MRICAMRLTSQHPREGEVAPPGLYAAAVEAGRMHEEMMTRALQEARAAAEHDDVPIGAVVAREGEVIAAAGNERELREDPTAHAEVLALREAARRVGNYRLTGAVVYSTVEPCVMCAGALVQARVTRLVYGARDEKAGAVESVFRVCDASSLNHRMELAAGVLEADCRALMQEFFRAKRKVLRAED